MVFDHADAERAREDPRCSPAVAPRNLSPSSFCPMRQPSPHRHLLWDLTALGWPLDASLSPFQKGGQLPVRVPTRTLLGLASSSACLLPGGPEV